MKTTAVQKFGNLIMVAILILIILLSTSIANALQSDSHIADANNSAVCGQTCHVKY